MIALAVVVAVAAVLLYIATLREGATAGNGLFFSSLSVRVSQAARKRDWRFLSIAFIGGLWLSLATPVGATDYGNLPLAFTMGAGGFWSGLCFVFMRWALGEEPGSRYAAGYWALCAINGVICLALVLPAGKVLMAPGESVPFVASIITFSVGLLAALLVACALKILRWLLRLAAGTRTPRVR